MKQYGVPVFAVCDDGRIGQELDGVRISDIADVLPDDRLLIFITSGFNQAMKNKLKELGLYRYYREVDFGRYEPRKEKYSFFRGYAKGIEKCYALLSDEISKELFCNLVQYRISRERKYIEGMMETTQQYFPATPNLRRTIPGKGRHIFMDLGAYDGDSIKGFLNYTGYEYEKIYAVEASSRNYLMLEENCRSLENIEMINIGISDDRKQVPFNVSDAKNSFASDEGDCLMEVDSIDNILQGRRVSFIKMDIEGAEFDAIKGAKKTIVQYCPILAVSIYHLTEDLFRIQLEIEDILPGAYDYYIRHYSPTVIETILYAVPKKK